MTYDDIDNDLLLISDLLDNRSKKIPSAAKVWGYAGFIPGVCVALNFLTAVGIFIKSHGINEVVSDNFLSFITDYLLSFGGATLVIGIFMMLFIYPNTLLYLSVSDELKEKSVIVSKIVKKIRFFIFLLFAINVIAMVVGFINPYAIFVTPISLVCFLFITMIALSTETARYGLIPMMNKLSAVVRKI